MERRNMLSLVAIILLVFASLVVYNETRNDNDAVAAEGAFTGDYDPLVDLEVVFRIDRIRMIDFDYGDKPVFVLDISVNGNAVTDIGPWGGLDVHPRWRHIQNIDDTRENVTLEVSLFTIAGSKKTPCDIGPKSGDYTGRSLALTYSLRDGSWHGDDALHDPSGLGRVSGIEDGVSGENDCELWFTVYQTDADGDRLTWFEETYGYGTDPAVSDAGTDADGDGVPIEWEDLFGYDPNKTEDHAILDPDADGIQNVEEYRMWEYGADPFRQDVFVEVDFMQNRFLGTTTLSAYSKQMVVSAFSRKNIVLHIDDGLMGGGGEILPYEQYYTPEKLAAYYREYFLHNGERDWRRGVFRYGVIVQYIGPAKRSVAGYSYWPANDDTFSAFAVAQRAIKNWRFTPAARETALGGLFMHELGHTLGIFWQTYQGCDNMSNVLPWLPGWETYENYLSCMNYRYAWEHIDYSDGSHGSGDFNDWAVVDPSFFEKRFFGEDPIVY
jgi:hypothetical protein